MRSENSRVVSAIGHLRYKDYFYSTTLTTWLRFNRMKAQQCDRNDEPKVLISNFILCCQPFSMVELGEDTR